MQSQPEITSTELWEARCVFARNQTTEVYLRQFGYLDAFAVGLI